MSRAIAPDPALVYLGFAPLGPQAALIVEGAGKWRFDWKTGPKEAHFYLKWTAPPPMELGYGASNAVFRRFSARLEEWSRDLTRLVCTGAGARGRCVSIFHSSISFILLEAREDKKLNKLRFCRLRKVERTRSSPARMEQKLAPMEANGQFGRSEDRGRSKVGRAVCSPTPAPLIQRLFSRNSEFWAVAAERASVSGATACEEQREPHGAAGEVRPSDRTPCVGEGRAVMERASKGGDTAMSENSLTVFPLDMFGQPVPPRRGPGRPRHLPTSESRALVERLRGAGVEQAEIAEALGVSLPTLRLNYPIELQSQSQTGARRDQRDRRKNP